MDQQKPQTCKQNKAHEEWNVSFSCYNTISERSSIIHFVKICSRHTWTWYLSDFVLQLQYNLLHEKELSIQFLILANKSLPVNARVSTRFAYINTNDDTGHTAERLDGQHQQDTNLSRKTLEKHRWKYQNCSEIPAFCPCWIIALPDNVTSDESWWWCRTLETTHERMHHPWSPGRWLMHAKRFSQPKM